MLNILWKGAVLIVLIWILIVLNQIEITLERNPRVVATSVTTPTYYTIKSVDIAAFEPVQLYDVDKLIAAELDATGKGVVK